MFWEDYINNRSKIVIVYYTLPILERKQNFQLMLTQVNSMLNICLYLEDFEKYRLHTVFVDVLSDG